VRKWIAPYSGTVNITGNVRKQETGGGDGVSVTIKKNASSIWGTNTLAYNDSIGLSPNIQTAVTAGDAIYFEVGKISSDSYDSAIWDPTISYVDSTQAGPWYLNTADTNLVLSVSGNMPTITMLKNPGRNFNWTASPTRIPLMSRVNVGANQYNTDWVFQDAAVDTSSGYKVTLRFTNASPSLELKSVWWTRSTSGVGPIEHWMTIKNNSGGTVTVFQQESLDMTVTGDGNSTLIRVAKDGHQADGTGVYGNTLNGGSSIDAAVTVDDNSNYPFIPCIFLQSSNNHGIYVAWEWPHGRINTAATGTSPYNISIKAGLNTDFKTDIENGDIYDIPPVYIGAYNGDANCCLDNGSNSLKKWLYNYKTPDTVCNNSNEPLMEAAVEGQADLNQTPFQTTYTKANVQTALDTYPLGTYGWEELVVDLGWWKDGEPGNWKGHPTYWPNGIAEFGPMCHTAGVKASLYFLLFDGNTTDPDSLTSIGPNGHPEWFSNDNMASYGRQADLGNADCVNWIRNRMASVMNEGSIDTYRSDFYPILVNGSNNINRHKYGALDTQYWCARGYYEILDYLKENVTGFRYDCCSWGGCLKDFATLKRATYFTITDVLDATNNRKAFYDSSFCIPPSQLRMVSDISTTIGLYTAMLAKVAWAYDLNASDVAYYKTNLRPLIRTADLYHITGRPTGSDWDAVEYYDPATQKGAVYVFKPTGTSSNTTTICFDGLDAAKTYTVDFKDHNALDTTKTGAELMAGFSITLTETNTADIILIY
jgi:Alpha-galactosidase